MEDMIVVAVKGIIVHDNKVLIVQRSSNDEIGANTWEFAGGKIHFGENLEESLKREIEEETGLSTTVGRLLYATTFQKEEHCQAVILTYLCSPIDIAVTLSEEHINYLWADQAQMMNLLAKPIIDDLSCYEVWKHIFHTNIA